MDTTQKFKCFIIDDDIFIANIIKKVVSDKGYSDVTIFTSGIDALHCIHENPSVILLDIQMDQLNGFEVLKKIKRYNPDIYVVMISGQEDMRTALNTLRYGAFDYIIKSETLPNDITKTLEKVELVDQKIKSKKPSLVQKIINLAI